MTISRATIVYARRVIITSAWIVAACGGNKQPTTIIEEPTPAIVMRTSVSSLSVTQGSASSLTATIERVNFNGEVTIIADNVPSGIVMTPMPLSVSSGATNTPITFTTVASTAPGVFTIILTASGSNVAPSRATIVLTVAQAAPQFSLHQIVEGNTSLVAGGLAVTVPIGITRANYPGVVEFGAINNRPVGLTFSYVSASTVTDQQSILFKAAANTPPGTYTLSVTATGTALQPISTPITIDVASAAPIVLAQPFPITIGQGGLATATVNFIRTSLPGPVSFSVTGVPQNVTATFTSNPTSASTTGLQLAVAGTAVPGTYPILITATGPASSVATVVATLIVVPGSPSGMISVQFCRTAIGTPVWFGYATNGTNWQRLPLTPDGIFTFMYPANGSVAWVNQDGTDNYAITYISGSSLDVLHAARYGCETPTLKMHTGTVTGITAGDSVGIAMATRSPVTAANSTAPDFTIPQIPDRPYDLLATRFSFEAVAQQQLLNRMFVRRAVNVADNASLGNVDFAGAESFAPTISTARVLDMTGATPVQVYSALLSAGQTRIGLGATSAMSGSNASYWHLPSSRVMFGDITLVGASTTGVGGLSVRVVEQFEANPGSVVLSLSEPMTEPTLSADPGGDNSARLHVRYNANGLYESLNTFRFTQVSGTTRRTLTSNIIAPNSGSMLDLGMPDFSGAEGWNDAWAPRRGVSGLWTLTGEMWINPAGFRQAGIGLNSPVVSGMTIRRAIRSGTFVP